MLDEVKHEDTGTRPWAAELCHDMGFLEARCRELGFVAVERALRQAADEHGGMVAAIHRALRAEAHRLRRNVSALPVLIESRLRSAGWEASQIERSLRFPAGRPALRLRHPVTTSQAELTLEGHQEGIWACAVTPDGQRLVSASRDTTIRVWDLRSGEALSVLCGHDAEVRDCAVMPDGQRIVSASADRTLRVWDLETGRTLVTLAGHEHRVLACAVTPDGRRIVSASSDRTLRIWDPHTGEALAVLEGHRAEVRDCAVTPDGRRVVSVSKDGRLILWDLTTGEVLAMLQGSDASLKRCAMSPDGKRVIATTNKSPGLLVAWDLETRRPIATFRGHTENVMACVVTPDGRHVISTSPDQTMRVWELTTGREVAVLDIRRLGHRDIVVACAVTPDGGHIVNASWDCTLRVWSLAAATAPIAVAQGRTPSRGFWHCTPTLDGRRALTVSHGPAFQVWSLSTGRVLTQFTPPLSKDFSGRTMAIGERRIVVQEDRALRALDLETGREIATLARDDIRISGGSMVRGDRWVVFHELRELGLYIWDLEMGRTMTLDEARRLGCATTPGQRCAFIDGSIVVWDERGALVSVFETAVDFTAMTWSATSDGRYLVTVPVWLSSNSDKSVVCIWEVATGTPIVTIALEARPSQNLLPVVSYAVTPDGRRLYTSILGGCIRLWDLRTGASITTLHIDGDTLCLAATNETLCAGDLLGNLWIFEAPPA